MIERQGSGIRDGRLFAFESSLRGDGNPAPERGALPVRAMPFKGARAGQRSEVRERRVRPRTPRAGAPPGACPAGGEAS